DRVIATNVVIDAKTNSTRLKLTALPTLSFGDCFDFSILGQASIDGTQVTNRAATSAALRRVFPEMPYPPASLAGLITLSIAGTTASTPPRKTKKKKWGAGREKSERETCRVGPARPCVPPFNP